MEFHSAEFLGSTNGERVAKCRAFPVEAEQLARAATGDTRDGYFDLAKSWSELANELEAAESRNQRGWVSMSPVDKAAIADFLKAGGCVSRIKESVRVSEAELLDYLASCGVAAKYRAGDSRTYVCQGKLVSATKLVAIANEHRRSLELPPFSLRVAIRYTGPTRIKGGMHV